MPEPLVSIIFSVHNNEHSIVKCLECLAKQKYRNIELIVIDDFSTDRTPELIASSLQRFDSPHHIRNERQIGEGKSLNKGIEVSRGEFIYFIAGDIYTEVDSLLEAVRFLQSQPANTIAVMGSVYNYDRSYWSMVRHATWFGGIQKKVIRKIHSCARCNTLMRRSVFNQGDRFTGNIRSGDVEFSSRLTDKGYDLLYFPKLRAWHDHPHSWLDHASLMKRAAKGYVESRTHYTNMHYNYIKNRLLFLVLLPFLPLGSTLKKVLNGNQRDILMRYPLLAPAVLVGQVLFWYYVAKEYRREIRKGQGGHAEKGNGSEIAAQEHIDPGRFNQ